MIAGLNFDRSKRTRASSRRTEAVSDGRLEAVTASGTFARGRVSDRENFLIDFTYDRQVAGNLEKAYQTLELWLQTYPRGEEDPSPLDLLGAFPRMGPADLKERSRHPGKNSRPSPTLSLGTTVLRPAIFF